MASSAPTFDVLAETYEAAIGPRTRLVLLTHPSNLTGQLLPVRCIAEAADRVGAEVVVDRAQSFGVVDDPITSFECDYYGGSAHKWLGAPVDVGVLWMRPSKVQKVWPLVPPPPDVKGMDRFQWVGTVPAYVEPAVLPAIALHRTLGPARKGARLRYLTAYWRRRAAAALPDARFYTTDAAEASIGLCTIEMPGVDANMLQQRLRTRHRILVQSMADNARAPEIRGIRVTPNVFTTPAGTRPLRRRANGRGEGGATVNLKYTTGKLRACLALVVSLPALLLSASAQTPARQPLVLTNVTLIDTTGGPSKPAMTVVIAGDRIARLDVTAKSSPPEDAQVIDASGKFLIPGPVGHALSPG